MEIHSESIIFESLQDIIYQFQMVISIATESTNIVDEKFAIDVLQDNFHDLLCKIR
jgi:hypothetical protein